MAQYSAHQQPRIIGQTTADATRIAPLFDTMASNIQGYSPDGNKQIIQYHSLTADNLASVLTRDWLRATGEELRDDKLHPIRTQGCAWFCEVEGDGGRWFISIDIVIDLGPGPNNMCTKLVTNLRRKDGELLYVLEVWKSNAEEILKKIRPRMMAEAALMAEA